MLLTFRPHDDVKEHSEDNDRPCQHHKKPGETAQVPTGVSFLEQVRELRRKKLHGLETSALLGARSMMGAPAVSSACVAHTLSDAVEARAQGLIEQLEGWVTFRKGAFLLQ